MIIKSTVTIQAVSKSFGKQSVLRNINLTIKKGEIFGLLGPSGSGKTTLVKTLIGLDTPDNGSITVLDNKMPNLKVMERIGYMAQADALYQELTAMENLDFFATLYGIKGQKKKEQIEASASLVGLTNDLNKPVSKFSGGMKRRLSICIALLNEPDLLILDEPTVGIDPVLRQNIWRTFEQLKEKGTSIIVTTHVMDEAEKCDTLGMIRDGQLIAVDTPKNLKEACHASSMEEAFLYYGGMPYEN
ncbi:ABC transporter ATP-binding protein [Niallia sp. NCCP-28]|uniref:ABC transporter ATP-binding protein n=1 Tax=Niallia sp. NCCP-28 TaxID=2934712 RepID=UPI0020869040|nr:ABC transporter ATP-binding protein [Niallia sp. NCCP-28]GKU83732.1 ABC transporter ATP-binding protein [Niallia sp. NCCP-28]